MSAVPNASEVSPLQHLVARIDQLAVLPHVVFKVLELSGNMDAPSSELERAIIVDPGFSSKLLTMANSSYYGLPRKVTSIKEALVFLGFRQVRNLAMTVGVFDLFVGKTDKESLRRREWWRTSVDAAVGCKYAAFMLRTGMPDDAYTCGLLHLIGKTLLDRTGDRDYDLVIQLTEKGLDVRDAERKVYGCDHIEVAVAAADKWGLPEVLVTALNYEDSSTETEGVLRPVTAVGVAIAKVAREGYLGEGTRGSSLPAWAKDALRIDEARADTLVEGGCEAIASAQLHV